MEKQRKTISCPDRYFSASEEKKLSEFLKNSAAICYGKTRKDMMAIAETHTTHKGLLRKKLNKSSVVVRVSQ